MTAAASEKTLAAPFKASVNFRGGDIGDDPLRHVAVEGCLRLIQCAEKRQKPRAVQSPNCRINDYRLFCVEASSGATFQSSS